MTDNFLDHHDALLFDLDGTVYRGGVAVAGAAEAVEAARRHGVEIRYVTNNASKSPEQVASHLTSLGVAAETHEISTSSQAASMLLAQQLPAGAPVLVVGTGALRAEVTAAGLVPVRRVADEPVAVVQGHSPDTGWEDLAEACLAIRGGALWIACNADTTLPSDRGDLPGNGAMVAALRAATASEPSIAGKPQPPLFTSATKSARAQRPLVVGDRLDTDIAGAVRAEIPSLAVLTGVSTPADMLFASPTERPTYIADDLNALSRPLHDATIADQPEWTVRGDGTGLTLAASAGRGASAPVSALRALCAAWWPVGSGPVDVRGTDQPAKEVLDALGIPRASNVDE